MVYKFKIDDKLYFFDGENLELFSDFFIRENIVEDKIGVLDNNNILEKVNFIMTTKCNANCIYCYEKDMDYFKTKNSMTKLSADKAINDLVRQYKKIRTVSFFGGEPTLNFKIIEYLVSNLEKRIEIEKYEITTNGVLINNAMIAFFKNHNFKVVLSLDGPENIHDALRKNCPHHKVIKIISEFKYTNMNENIEINCTLTKYHENKIGYNELMKYYENIGLNYYLSNIITENEYLNIHSDISGHFGEIDMGYKNLTNNNKQKNSNLYISSVINALVNKEFYKCFCTEIENSITIDCEGLFHPCNMFLGSKINNNLDLLKLNNKDNHECRSCWAKGLCFQCTASMFFDNDKPFNNGIYSCNSKKLYEYALKKLIEYYHFDLDKFQLIIDNYFNG